MEDSQKTEKQKMLAGELYLSSDAELKTLHRRACRLTRLYNSTTEEESERRSQILQELLGKVGSNAYIEPPFHCDYGGYIYVGNKFYMNYGGVILDGNTIEIGDNVLCAPYVQIYSATHPTDPTIRRTGLEFTAPVKIGNNVWIGGGAIICPGVTIGDNTTIGAGSVVVKSIPDNVVAAGNPCRIIRHLD